MEHMETETAGAGPSQATRRRTQHAPRRRTRSTGSLPLVWQAAAAQRGLSDDSSSSVNDKGPSDSDDVLPMSLRPHPGHGPYPHPAHLHQLMESDSVNENFSPVRPCTRRKRKFKRLAVDVEMAVGGGMAGGAVGVQRPPMSCMLVSSGKKKRVLRHVPNCDNRYCLTGTSSGKRKRSVRSEAAPALVRAAGFAAPATREDTASALHRLSLRDPAQPPQPMDVGSLAHQQMVVASSSSVSSSESDTGVFTNDEGREGDDEQSDWFGEAKGWWAADSDRDDDMEPTFAAILGSLASGPAGTTADASHPPHRHHHHRCTGGGGREMRGGRRRVRAERPSFSVLTSANEQLSKFLQDPGRSELKLHPMRRREREQLCHLADLYSLDMRVSTAPGGPHQLTCPVLTKTSNTVKVEQEVRLSRLGGAASDFKRRRKQAPGHHSSPPDAAPLHHHQQHMSHLLGHKSS